jgi:hypothetical protein
MFWTYGQSEKWTLSDDLTRHIASTWLIFLEILSWVFDSDSVRSMLYHWMLSCQNLQMGCHKCSAVNVIKKTKTPSPESSSELHWLSDRRFSAKLMSTFAGRGCHVVSMTEPYCHILGFLDRSRYFFFESSSSIVLTRLSGPNSIPTTSQKIW